MLILVSDIFSMASGKNMATFSFMTLISAMEGNAWIKTCEVYIYINITLSPREKRYLSLKEIKIFFRNSCFLK